MKDISVQYIGMDYSNFRIWGFLSVQGKYGKEYYTFWGKKQNSLYFKWTPDDAEFRRNAYKKSKKYTKIQADGFTEEFEQFMILKKLKS